MYGQSLVSDPVNQPLQLKQVLQHLNLEWDNHAHEYVKTVVMPTVTRVSEETLGRQLITATRAVRLATFPKSNAPICLPWPPLQAVDAVRYYDSLNALTVFAATDYTVTTDTEPGTVEINSGLSWPPTYSREFAVEVEFTCGYGADYTTIPGELSLLMLDLCRHVYDTREPPGESQLKRMMSYSASDEWVRYDTVAT